MALRCTVVSLVPFPINEEKPGLIPGRFHIPASDMKIPSVLHVGTANHYVYLDESRGMLPVRNPPDIVCKSIVNDYIESQLGVSEDCKPALFWLEDDCTPDEVILKHRPEMLKALLDQKKWMIAVSTIADNDWARYHQHNVISSFQRECAQYIGWNPTQHEWMAPQTTLSDKTCPACAMSVAKDLPICPNCKCILDKDKYKELSFAK